MLVVNRFKIPLDQAEGFVREIEAAHATLADQRGYVEGWVGRNVDDQELWVLTTRWEHVGAYRRALSTYAAKLTAVPVLCRAMDEPSAYEVVEPGADPAADLNRVIPRENG